MTIMLKDKITRHLLLIALFAIVVRLAYQAAMLHFGGSFDNGSDSGIYLNIAREFLSGGWGSHSGDQLERMPLYPAFLAAIFHIAGLGNLRAVATMQAFIDSASVIGIGVAARSMSGRFAVPSALAAAIIPNFLVHASYVLTETLFTVFFVWGLCALMWALRRNTVPLLVAGGALFGLALLTRPVMVYYFVFLTPALGLAFYRQRTVSAFRCFGLAAIPAVVIFAFAAPRAIDHYRYYGYLTLSAQEGTHMLNWFYGCLASSTPCAKRGRIVEEMRPIAEQRIAALGKNMDNPFAVSAVETQLAIEKILSMPPAAIATSMSAGMFRVLMQTGFYESFSQFRREPSFLSAMPGNSTSEQLRHFITTNKTNAFMILWVLAQAALVLSRLVQLAGLFRGLREPTLRGATLILAATIAYFLVLTGPVASPKYRMPIEPPLLILFGMGWVWLRDHRPRPVATLSAA
jgi:4-amino-4-deoxy-L-arabinose transferase-like glycosyltransferase